VGTPHSTAIQLVFELYEQVKVEIWFKCDKMDQFNGKIQRYEFK